MPTAMPLEDISCIISYIQEFVFFVCAIWKNPCTLSKTLLFRNYATLVMHVLLVLELVCDVCINFFELT